MKTFLLVLLLVVAAIVAFKLLPALLAFGCLLLLGVFVALSVGFSLLAVGFCVGLVLLAVLAPIWLPALALLGLILLVRRLASPARRS